MFVQPTIALKPTHYCLSSHAGESSVSASRIACCCAMSSSSRRGRVTARLYTGSGGWGLPTIDADGLSAHALLQFASIPYASVEAPRAPTDPPVVVFERSGTSGQPSSASGLTSLIGTLTSDPALPDPNLTLTPFMTAEATAFATLVSARFAPARLYEFYIKNVNYDDVYHTVLSSSSPFPLNRIVPYMARRELRAAFAATRKTPQECYFDAGIAVAALSARLGSTNKFFYGEKPAVLDAIVFGQLAAVLFVPLPDSQLRHMVASHANLVNFVMRIKNEYFPEDGAGGWGGELDAAEVARVRREGAEKRAAEQRAQEMAKAVADDAQREGRGDNDPGNFDAEAEDEEAKRRRHNVYFIYGSVAVFVAHLLFGSEIEFDLGGE
jgi:metaxin